MQSNSCILLLIKSAKTTVTGLGSASRGSVFAINCTRGSCAKSKNVLKTATSKGSAWRANASARHPFTESKELFDLDFAKY